MALVHDIDRCPVDASMFADPDVILWKRRALLQSDEIDVTRLLRGPLGNSPLHPTINDQSQADQHEQRPRPVEKAPSFRGRFVLSGPAALLASRGTLSPAALGA